MSPNGVNILNPLKQEVSIKDIFNETSLPEGSKTSSSTFNRKDIKTFSATVRKPSTEETSAINLTTRLVRTHCANNKNKQKPTAKTSSKTKAPKTSKNSKTQLSTSQTHSKSVDDLTNGKWFNVFKDKGLKFGKTILQVTEASINQIFSWDQSSIPNAYKLSFAQAICDLLELPTGRKLFENIVKIHHNNVGLSKLIFHFDSSDNRSKCDWFDYPEPCKISLKYKDNMCRGTSWLFFVKDLEKTIEAEVPASVVLAHELGHYISGIYIQSNMAKEFNHIRYAAAMTDARNNNGIIHDPCTAALLQDIMSRADNVMTRYSHTEYENLLKGVINILNPSPLEKTFLELWNGDYDEILNILPKSTIFKKKIFDFSDGQTTMEAFKNLHQNKKPIFSGLKDDSGLQDDLNIDTISEKNLVRLSHFSAKDYHKEISSLKGDKERQFYVLIKKLLDKLYPKTPQNFNTVSSFFKKVCSFLSRIITLGSN